MSDFTPQQQCVIMTYYRNFQAALAGRICDAQTAQSILEEAFPIVDCDKLQQDCLLMEAGVRRFMAAYYDTDAQVCVDAAAALENLTKDMNPQQRKGFYLTVYDALRESDSEICQEAEEAQEGRELVREVDEAELKDLVIRQVSAHAKVIAGECAEDELTEEPMADVPADPMLMAMANYAAALDGTLPEYYENSPEIMGIFAAASCVMAKEIQDNPELAEDQNRIAELVMNVAGVALLVALAAWCVPTAIAAVKPVLAALSTGNFGILLTQFKHPLIHCMKAAKYFLPAAAIAAMHALVKMMQDGKEQLQAIYGKVKSKVRILLGRDVAVNAPSWIDIDLEDEDEEDEDEDEDDFY